MTAADSKLLRCRFFQTGSWRWSVSESYAVPEFLRRLAASHQLLEFPAQPVERIPPRTATELVRLALPEQPARPLFVKYYRPRTFWNTCKDLFRRSRARRAFENALLLQRLNIRTAPPVAYGENRRWLWLHECFVICEEVPQAVTLHHFYQGGSDPHQRLIAVRALARQMAALHDARFSHTDPHALNFLVSHGDCKNLAVIDLDALRRQRWFTFRNAVRDLRKMRLRSPLTARGNLRFAIEYARTRAPQLSARKLIQAIGDRNISR